MLVLASCKQKLHKHQLSLRRDSAHRHAPAAAFREKAPRLGNVWNILLLPSINILSPTLYPSTSKRGGSRNKCCNFLVPHGALLLAVVYMTCRTHSLIPVLSAFYLIAFQQKKESTCKPCKPCTGGNTYLTGAETMWDSQPRHHRGHCKFLPFLFQSDTEITILAAYMMVKHTPAGPLLSPADWITCIEDLEPARNSPSLSQCFRWQRQRCQL